MRRALAVLAAAAITVLAASVAGAGGAADPRYVVELDHAFGLVNGADLKVAGVRAGRIVDLRVDERTRHALVEVEIEREGFGSLRTDARCETRPQSLIGEYFIDCDPGRAPTRLPVGGRVSVERTASSVPPDLLADVLRRPYRERFRIILNQLGVGLGARGEALGAAIRRASPGLRETDRVLAVLARQNRVLRDLVGDADTVVHGLAGNRRDVARWVREAGDAAAVSAERRREIAAGLARLPGFLRELRPTMAELARAADAQAPALADLGAAAPGLTRLLQRLKPFSQATRVNLRSLGAAARTGRPAVRAAQPVVEELGRFSGPTPELANNLAIVLGDLDDRSRAWEKDPRSPGGEGYTGFEALLQYVYDQALAINIFDAHGYMLKANLFVSECSDYQNAETLAEKVEEDPEFYERCASIVGPHQPGVLQPDPTKPAGAGHARRAKPRSRRPARRRDQPQRRRRAGARPGRPDAQPSPGPEPRRDPVGSVVDQIQDLLDGTVPGLELPAPGADVLDRREDLLDFLLGP